MIQIPKFEYAGIKVYTAPSSEPVSLAEAKLHCRIDIDDDDDFISSLITAARSYCETFTRRAFVTQTLEITLDNYPDLTRFRNFEGGYPTRLSYCYDFARSTILLPRNPIQSVSSITYLDGDGVSTVLSASNYRVDIVSEPARVTPAYSLAWPTTQWVTNAITIRYIAGYGAASAVPAELKAAIKLLVGHWYENRESVNIGNIVTEMPMAVESLLWSKRLIEAA